MRCRIGKVIIEDQYARKDEQLLSEEEKKIAEIVSGCAESEYNQKIAQEKNWAVLFSLSHIRWNAVEWLPIKKGDRILEIEAGTGALTGILAEKSGSVTCIEKNIENCRINATRNQNREGIEIYAGDYLEIAAQLDQKFDWIFLMGAFEAGGELMPGDTPHRDLLESVKERLLPGGRIVLACENRLGLRYFAGCREDNSGEYFTGIEGYDEESRKKTFSRPELEKVIHQAGLNQMEFYYPYPDYRLPMTIYSDDYLPKVGELWDNMRNFDQERYVLFDESKAFDQIIEDGLFPVFSNSFLVVIQADAEKKPGRRTIFSKYSNERSERFAIRTDIEADENGTRYARKSACYPEGREHIEKLENWMKELTKVYEKTPMTMNHCRKTDHGVEIDYLTGETLEERMDHLLLEGQTKKAIELLMSYIEAIRKAGSTERFHVTEAFEKVFGEVLLPEELTCSKVTDIDMVAGNAICTNNGWIHMDYEWTFDFPIPVNYVIYRMIQNYLYGNVQRRALHKELLYKKAGLTEQEIAQYTKMEQAFQTYITGKHIPLRYLYDDISPGCVNFKAEEAHRKAIADANARANKGIEVFVDTFEIAMTGIHVHGWAVSKADKQVQFTLLDEQGKELETVHTEYLYRRDVVDQFKLSGKNSKAGFHVECRLPDESGKNRSFTLLARDGISEVAFPIPVEKLRIKQSKIGKKLMDLRGAKDVISYIAPHEMGFFGEAKTYRVENQRFDTWRMANRLTQKQKERQSAATFTETDKITVLLPVRAAKQKQTEASLASILAQTMRIWEVILICPKEADAEKWTQMDPDGRIRTVQPLIQEAQESWYEAGRKIATGTYLLLMQPGDLLEADAFYRVAKERQTHPQERMIYSDSDKIDLDKETYFDPQFKPDDSPYTLQSGNYIGPSIWMERQLVEECGGIREEYGKAALFDLILRCRERSGKMAHISRILYHQSNPVHRNMQQRQELVREWEDGKRVLQNYYQKRKIQAQIVWANYPLRYHVTWPVEKLPKVSVIIPNQDHIKDLDQCLKSIVDKTTYTNYEILVVENNSRQEQTFVYYRKMLEKYKKIRLLNWKKEFNYSAINNFAVRHAEGEYFIFLNNDTEILTENWIEEMLYLCQQKDVGAVGSKLYYPDGTIQHAGVILGLGNIAGHIFVKEPGEISGYMGRACVMQNLSAVTAACMMVSRESFEAVHGFEETLQVALNDVDLCMKIQEHGKMVLFNPEVELYHYESKSRGLEDTPEKKARYDREVAYFRNRWKEILEKGDPYYNVNLSRTTWNCTFRIPPRED